jgi:hypothetical protein
MAWPSGSKANTTYTDQGSDLISNARADINQNILNTNSVIDEFDISSPTDGDILQYNSSSGHWDSISPSAAGLSNTAMITLNNDSEELVSGNTYRRNFTIDFDPNSFLSKSGDFQLVLTAGSYLMYPTPHTTDDEESAVTIYNETGSADLVSNFLVANEIGTSGEAVVVGQGSFTLGSSINVAFRQTNATLANRDMTTSIVIIKI